MNYLKFFIQMFPLFQSLLFRSLLYLTQEKRVTLMLILVGPKYQFSRKLTFLKRFEILDSLFGIVRNLSQTLCFVSAGPRHRSRAKTCTSNYLNCDFKWQQHKQQRQRRTENWNNRRPSLRAFQFFRTPTWSCEKRSEIERNSWQSGCSISHSWRPRRCGLVKC